MRDAVWAADDYLAWVSSGVDSERINREALIKLYKQFAAVTKPRRSVTSVENMTNACLLEEVVLAALSVKYDALAQYILEQLTPGRSEFEALCEHTPVCYACLNRYRYGELSWAEAVDRAYRELLWLIDATAKALGVDEVKLPDLGAGFGVREKVQYCAVLSGLLKEYQRVQAERAMVHIDPVTFMPPDLT